MVWTGTYFTSLCHLKFKLDIRGALQAAFVKTIAWSFLTLALSFVSLGTIFLLTANIGLVLKPVCGFPMIADTSACRFVLEAHGRVAGTYLHQAYPELFHGFSSGMGDVVQDIPLVHAASIDLTKAHTTIDDIMLAVKHTSISRKEEILLSLDVLVRDTWSAGLQMQSFGIRLDGSAER